MQIYSKSTLSFNLPSKFQTYQNQFRVQLLTHFPNNKILALTELNIFNDALLFSTESQLLMTLKKKSLGNTVGKNTGNQHFLCLKQCFQLYHKEKLSVKHCLICCLQMLSNLVRSKNLLFGKGLNDDFCLR